MHPKPVNTAFGSLSGGQNAPDPSIRERGALGRADLPPELQETGAPARTVGDRPDRENRDDRRSRRRRLSHSRSDSSKDRFHHAIAPRQVKRKGFGGHDTRTLLE